MSVFVIIHYILLVITYLSVFYQQRMALSEYVTFPGSALYRQYALAFEKLKLEKKDIFLVSKSLL